MLATAKSEYAVRALIELASTDEELLSSSQIAERQMIPEVYLKQILAQLKQADIIIGERGMHGGYRLDTDPEALHFRRVGEVIEGDIKSSYCKVKGEQECGCFYQECELRTVWDAAERSYLEELEQHYIADFTGFRKQPAEPSEDREEAPLGD